MTCKRVGDIATPGKLFTVTEGMACIGPNTYTYASSYLHSRSLGIAPPWQDPVPLVRPGETYRITESRPLRIARGFDGHGTLAYAWLLFCTVENDRGKPLSAPKPQPNAS